MNQPILDRQVVPEDEFLQRVRSAAAPVLGNSQTGLAVRALCDDHERARRLIAHDRTAGNLVVAIVGATGQGKSWMIQQIIRQSEASRSVRSGNNADQTTEDLVWIGPQPPADLDTRFEKFIRVSSAEMEPLGAPYLLVDTPGSTDDRQAIADVARRALSLASAIVLVVRRDQIRGNTPASLASASEGTILIPVINTIGKDDPSLESDIDAFLANLRDVAPASIVARPIQVEDHELVDEQEDKIGRRAAQALMARLKSTLEDNPDSDRRKSARLAALDARFRFALSGLLADELPGLTRAVKRLNDEATKLPGEVAGTLLGPQGPMQAAVRSRLRLALLTQTSAIWFPYRSLLGALNLTHGAWDRVLLSLSGSLPSLVSTIWTSTRALTMDRDANDEVRDGLSRRSAAAVSDRLGPLASQFRQELAILRRQSDVSNEDADAQSTDANVIDSDRHVASLAGIETLQEHSQTIFEDCIEQNSITQTASLAMALLGTLIFWLLMAGPFVALYQEYLLASYDSVTQLGAGAGTGGGAEHSASSEHSGLERFPRPEFSMVATSVLLSLLPTAVFAMIAISIAQSASRTRRTMRAVRERHDETIAKLQHDGVLRLRWDDPLLSDAEFLVSAGKA